MKKLFIFIIVFLLFFKIASSTESTIVGNSAGSNLFVAKYIDLSNIPNLPFTNDCSGNANTFCNFTFQINNIGTSDNVYVYNSSNAYYLTGFYFNLSTPLSSKPDILNFIYSKTEVKTSSFFSNQIYLLLWNGTSWKNFGSQTLPTTDTNITWNLTISSYPELKDYIRDNGRLDVLYILGSGSYSETVYIDYMEIILSYSTDDDTPQWSGNYSQTPYYYSSNIYSSNFSINVFDTSVSTVLLESNFTGSLKNYTMTSPWSNATYIYQSSLPAGSYRWKVYMNDSKNRWNYTSVYYTDFINKNPNYFAQITCSPPSGITYGTSSTCSYSETNEGDNDVIYNFTRITGVNQTHYNTTLNKAWNNTVNSLPSSSLIGGGNEFTTTQYNNVASDDTTTGAICSVSAASIGYYGLCSFNFTNTAPSNFLRKIEIEVSAYGYGEGRVSDGTREFGHSVWIWNYTKNGYQLLYNQTGSSSVKRTLYINSSINHFLDKDNKTNIIVMSNYYTNNTNAGSWDSSVIVYYIGVIYVYDEKVISGSSESTTLSAGLNKYIIGTTTGTFQNYTFNTMINTSLYYVFKQPSNIYLYINGTRNNVNLNQPFPKTMNFTAIMSNKVGENISIWSNYSYPSTDYVYKILATGVSPLENLTNIQSNTLPITFIFTSNYTETINYTGGYESWYLTLLQSGYNYNLNVSEINYLYDINSKNIYVKKLNTETSSFSDSYRKDLNEKRVIISQQYIDENIIKKWQKKSLTYDYLVYSDSNRVNYGWFDNVDDSFLFIDDKLAKKGLLKLKDDSLIVTDYSTKMIGIRRLTQDSFLMFDNTISSESMKRIISQIFLISDTNLDLENFKRITSDNTLLYDSLNKLFSKKIFVIETNKIDDYGYKKYSVIKSIEDFEEFIDSYIKNNEHDKYVISNIYVIENFDKKINLQKNVFDYFLLFDDEKSTKILYKKNADIIIVLDSQRKYNIIEKRSLDSLKVDDNIIRFLENIRLIEDFNTFIEEIFRSIETNLPQEYFRYVSDLNILKDNLFKALSGGYDVYSFQKIEETQEKSKYIITKVYDYTIITEKIIKGVNLKRFYVSIINNIETIYSCPPCFMEEIIQPGGSGVNLPTSMIEEWMYDTYIVTKKRVEDLENVRILEILLIILSLLIIIFIYNLVRYLKKNNKK